MNRKKKAALNTGVALLYEFVSIICGFILPRLILKHFGSSYNGLTSSIVQIISYVALLQSGIGGVTRAALYKPLAEKDNRAISGIVNATSLFMKKIAGIFALGLLTYSVLGPFLVSDEFEWVFTFSLILIIGISTFAQYYFSLALKMLLKADQREYISMLINICTIILNTIIATIIMNFGYGIRAVKLGSAAVYLLIPILTSAYVKQMYNIDKHIPPDNSAISQRWDSFAHQLANFIHGNTDIIILTFFTNMLEVSVYTVYYLIIHGVRKGIVALTTGIEAAFGNMIAKNEKDTLSNSFELFECIMFGITTLVMTVSAVLCLPFIKIYTSEISDVNYIRPLFCYVAIAGEFFYCVRIPYESVVRAAGHYKQTRNGALMEPIINIVFSIILVIQFGIVGVAIGTLIAMTFRTLQYMIYTARNIIPRSVKQSLKQWIVSILAFIGSFSTCSYIVPEIISDYGSWVLWAIICVLVAGMFEVVLNVVFNRQQIKSILQITKALVRRKI